MKKIHAKIISMTVMSLIMFFNCQKKPLMYNELISYTKNSSKKSNTDNYEYRDRIINNPTRQDPNPRMDEPNQPGCIPGNQSCYEVVVTPNNNPSEIWRLGIDNGNLPDVMTTEDIDYVSGNDHFLYNILMDVKNGVYEMSYLHFERGTGFFINETNPSINNCFCSFVIYNE
jgi:hypothetical protein